MADVVRNIPQVVKYKNGGKKKREREKPKKKKKILKNDTKETTESFRHCYKKIAVFRWDGSESTWLCTGGKENATKYHPLEKRIKKN